MDNELDADVLLGEIEVSPPKATAIAKVSYSHEAMIDLILSNPGIKQIDLAAHFGYSAPWVSRIIASDAFQAQMASRREEIVDPAIKATLEERFRALVIQSLFILEEKLNKPAAQVPDQVALRCVELGAKALGVGGHAPTPPAPAGDRLSILAERLIILQGNTKQERIVNEAQG